MFIHFPSNSKKDLSWHSYETDIIFYMLPTKKLRILRKTITFPWHSSLSSSWGSLLTLERSSLEKAFDELTHTKKKFTRIIFQRYPLIPILLTRGTEKQETIAEGHISKWRHRPRGRMGKCIWNRGCFPQSLPFQLAYASLSEYIVAQTLQTPRER